MEKRLIPIKTAPSLKISEIFCSLQGESTRLGLRTVFVRLTGCPLRCVWCDTAHAFSGGKRLLLPEILEKVAAFKADFVCVTGGEPLAQKNCLPLLKALCDNNYSVSLETSGALDISEVDSRVAKIVDLKAPDSGEFAKNHWQNLDFLTAKDELKLVLASRKDYEWARDFVAENAQKWHLPRTSILFSPVAETLNPTDLADWMMEDQLKIRFQLQLHKVLWGNTKGK